MTLVCLELEEMTGKERRKHNMNKLETLGVKKSKAIQMPIQMRLGMDKKQKERDQKKLQEAKDIGIYDKSLKHLYAAATKEKDRKPRDRGIGSGIGKMKGSTLVLSKTEIKRVERQGMKPKAGKRKQGGGGKGGGRGGGKSGGKGGGKKGKPSKGRRWKMTVTHIGFQQWLLHSCVLFFVPWPTSMTEQSLTSRKVHILVGATGSVASIKIPKLVHLLRQVWINFLNLLNLVQCRCPS